MKIQNLKYKKMRTKFSGSFCVFSPSQAHRNKYFIAMFIPFCLNAYSTENSWYWNHCRVCKIIQESNNPIGLFIWYGNLLWEGILVFWEHMCWAQ